MNVIDFISSYSNEHLKCIRGELYVYQIIVKLNLYITPSLLSLKITSRFELYFKNHTCS